MSPAGLLWQLRPSDVEVELLAHTRDVVSRDLPAETGLHTGWVENGGLFIASNKQRLDEYKRLMSVGRSPGVSLAGWAAGGGGFGSRAGGPRSLNAPSLTGFPLKSSKWPFQGSLLIDKAAKTRQTAPKLVKLNPAMDF